MTSFRLRSWNVLSATVGEGANRRSVGEVNITIKRDVGAVVSEIIVPSVALTAASFTVFVFPLSRFSYIVSRLGISFLATYALLELSDKIHEVRPAETVRTWLDIFHESNTVLAFFADGFNALVLLVSHVGHRSFLANMFDHELRLFLPALTVCIYVMCCLVVIHEFAVPMVLITRSMLALSMFVYFVGCMVRLRRK